MCIRGGYGYSNVDLEGESIFILSGFLSEYAKSREVDCLRAICTRIVQLHSEVPSLENFNLVEGLTSKYGEDASIILKAFYSPPSSNGNYTELADADSSRELEHTIKDKIKKAYSNECKNHGKSSLYSPVKIDNIMAADKVKWDKYLRQTISTSVSTLKIPNRLTRNRRFGFLYPGMKKAEMIEVVVAVDVSGSMPDELVTKIKSNIMSLQHRIGIECTIIEFDTKVVAEYPLKDLTSVRHSYSGTDLAAPIEWVIEHKKPRNTVVFIFTDGEGPTTIEERFAPRINDYTYNWMLIGKSRRCIEEFVGKKSRIVEVEL